MSPKFPFGPTRRRTGINNQIANTMESRMMMNTKRPNMKKNCDCAKNRGNAANSVDVVVVGEELVARLHHRRRRGVEDGALPVHRQRGVEREDEDLADLVAEVVDLRLGLSARVLDLLLAGEEDEDVALRLAQVDLHNGADGRLEVVALGLGRVEDLDRVQTAGHLPAAR